MKYSTGERAHKFLHHYHTLFAFFLIVVDFCAICQTTIIIRMMMLREQTIGMAQ